MGICMEKPRKVTGSGVWGGPGRRDGKGRWEQSPERSGRRWGDAGDAQILRGQLRGIFGGSGAVPAPTPLPPGTRTRRPQGKRLRISGRRGAAAPVPGSASVPRARGRGRPGARSPRAFGGLGARLNCENRDALPAQGDPAPRPNLCPGPGRGQPGRASNACPGSRSGPAHSGEPAGPAEVPRPRPVDSGPELPTALHSRSVSPIPSLG